MCRWMAGEGRIGESRYEEMEEEEESSSWYLWLLVLCGFGPRRRQ